MTRLGLALGGAQGNLHGPRRHGRPRADLHRRPIAQPPLRARAGARRERRPSAARHRPGRRRLQRRAGRAPRRARDSTSPMPIVEQLYKVLHEDLDPRAAVATLMRRPIAHELRLAPRSARAARRSRFAARPRKTVDRGRVRQIQAAIAGAHRDAQPRLGRATSSSTSAGKPRRFRAEQERVARGESRRRRATACARVVSANNRARRRAPRGTPRVRVLAHARQLVIIEAGAAHARVVDARSRADARGAASRRCWRTAGSRCRCSAESPAGTG